MTILSHVSNEDILNGTFHIPKGVTSISKNAFKWCSNLTHLEIPDTVTSIGEYAFFACTALTHIKIPDSVTSIGDGAFSSCVNLSEVELSRNLKSLEGSVFSNCSALTHLKIPQGVRSLDDYIFQQCFKLSHIWLPADFSMRTLEKTFNSPTPKYIIIESNDFVDVSFLPYWIESRVLPTPVYQFLQNILDNFFFKYSRSVASVAFSNATIDS